MVLNEIELNDTLNKFIRVIVPGVLKHFVIYKEYICFFT